MTFPRFRISSGVIILFGIAAVGVIWLKPREPEYLGKPLSECLVEIDGLSRGSPPPD